MASEFSSDRDVSELPELLGKILDVYQARREEYWKTRPDESDWSRTTQLFRQADSIADQLMADALAIASPTAAETKRSLGAVEHEYRDHELVFWRDRLPDTPDQPREKNARYLTELWDLDDIDEGLHRDSVLHKVWDRLCIGLATSMQERLREASKRVLFLVKHVEAVRPSQGTRDFLRRVSRCYIWGFDTECVVLCRSALDTALREHVPDSLCESVGLRRRNGHFQMADRIKAAHSSLLDDEAYEAATRVRVRGTKAVHYEAAPPSDVLGTVADMVLVLSQLTR